jgi:hypothetical protein
MWVIFEVLHLQRAPDLLRAPLSTAVALNNTPEIGLVVEVDGA